MDNILTEHSSFWICLALTLAIIAVFYQVYTYDFINYDDLGYIYRNLNVQAGITLKTVKWALTTGYVSNWHPLTWLSHMLDWQLFGPKAGGHHLTNLILHIANTLLLFIVLKQMTGAMWQSAFVAALFALHPLHVESVAWITERKDVLSTFFWLLTMWAYVRYVNRPKTTRYLLVVVFFALGLMAKPMLVTLPFVLLLLDYWPLERFSAKRVLPYLLIEKVPLFAMTLASCAATFIFQKKSGAMPTGENYNLSVRLANAFISYTQYIIKMIWPTRLAFFYPHPGRNVSILYAAISAIFLLAITVLVLRFAKDHRYLVTGWFWYLGTLVPVIGLVQVGEQALADRYSYITLTGLFIIIAWGLPDLLAKWPHRKIALWVSSLIVLFALAIQAHLQQRYWKNSITLCEHALKVTENNYRAHFGMTETLRKQGRIEEAIWHNTEAIRIRPAFLEAINGLGLALYKAGRIDEAIGCYKRALEISPRTVEVHVNLGAALCQQGKFDEAIYHYSEAIRIRPDDFDTLNDLGVVLRKAGRIDEAIGYYKRALELNPSSVEANANLGLALAAKGKFADAVSHYRVSLATMDTISTRISLGEALVRLGRFQEAATEFEKVLRVQPQNDVAHNDLGAALFQQRKFDEAIAHFNQAIRIDPNYTAARKNLNRALAEKQKLQNKTTENTKE
jgi:tetratricopeptide (TPR) repeat protein